VMIAVRVGTGHKKSGGGKQIFFMNESVDANATEPFINDKVTPERTYQVFAMQNRTLAELLVKALYPADDTVKPIPMATWTGRRAPMPSVVIYGGNISNAADAEELRNSDKMKEMSLAIAKTLVEFGLTTPATPVTPETTTTLPETKLNADKESK